MCVTCWGMLWLSRIVWSSADRQRGENKLELVSDIPSAHISLSSLLDISSHSSSEGSTHTHTHSVNIPSHSLCLVFSDTNTEIIPLISHISRKILRIAYNSRLPCSTINTHAHSPSEQHMLTMISSDVCCADSSALASRNSSLSLLKPTDTQQNHRSNCLGYLYTYSDVKLIL